VLTLSGGERQRAHFARVMAQLMAGASVAEGQVLLLDEPTASLDLSHQLRLLDGARRLAGERLAVLAIVHDLNLAAAYADVLVVMSQGRIVARGSPASVLTDTLMREVFEVPLKVGATPPPGQPFVLVNQARA
jgi:iron complex transport system ATP-binding protein